MLNAAVITVIHSTKVALGSRHVAYCFLTTMAVIKGAVWARERMWQSSEQGRSSADCKSK